MTRFAVYYAPRPGPFATATAALLGWDSAIGQSVAHPDLSGLPAALPEITTHPRKYGFHGTIRAPFRLAPSFTADDVIQAVSLLASSNSRIVFDGLQIENLDGFLALTPTGDTSALDDLAAKVVRVTNPLRAPMTPDERARRRPESLDPRQLALLDAWGYPFVMEEFQFHLTLTNRLAADISAPVTDAISNYLAPIIPQPFVIEDLCLLGEDAQGRFHLLHRFPLSG